MHKFAEAGVAVYALSYDEPDALQDFAKAHGITYTLLPDPESAIIRSFGILNTLIDPADHPWYGIPYPGTYVIDAQGTITHKFFDSNLAVRAGPEQLLRAVRCEELFSTEAETTANDAEPEAVQVDVQLDGNALALTVQRDLVIQFNVPPGRHVYAEPAPLGSVAADVQLAPTHGLVQRPVVHPPSKPHTLSGTGETFAVHDGKFELRVPITVNGTLRDTAGGIQVTGEVRWQSCDDAVCDIPTSQRFSLQIPVSDAPATAIGSKAGADLEPNAGAHFKRMVERRNT